MYCALPACDAVSVQAVVPLVIVTRLLALIVQPPVAVIVTRRPEGAADVETVNVEL